MTVMVMDDAAMKLSEEDRQALYTACLEAWQAFDEAVGPCDPHLWLAGAVCWLSGYAPSTNKLSEITGMDRRSVRRQQDRWKEIGFLDDDKPPAPTRKGVEQSQSAAREAAAALCRLRDVLNRVCPDH